MEQSWFRIMYVHMHVNVCRHMFADVHLYVCVATEGHLIYPSSGGTHLVGFLSYFILCV